MAGNIAIIDGHPDPDKAHSWLYRWYFLAHSLKSLERNILRLSGIKPVHETLIGGVEAGGAPARARWLETVRALGYAGK